jgi:CRP/FNR family transcriptional regulator, cyclic AMP receptor protein
LPIQVPNPVQLLRAVPLFSACTTKEIRILLHIAKRRTVPAGTVIVAEGDRDDRFYAIADGTVKVRRGRRTLGTFGPGEFFGEVAVLDPGPRTATVTAATDAVLYAIEGRDLLDLLLEAQHLSANLLRGLARRLREVDKAVKD